MWIDEDWNQPVTAFQIHWPEFVITAAGSDPKEDLAELDPDDFC